MEKKLDLTGLDELFAPALNKMKQEKVIARSLKIATKKAWNNYLTVSQVENRRAIYLRGNSKHWDYRYQRVYNRAGELIKKSQLCGDFCMEQEYLHEALQVLQNSIADMEE
jgi:hypothetical protein